MALRYNPNTGEYEQDDPLQSDQGAFDTTTGETPAVGASPGKLVDPSQPAPPTSPADAQYAKNIGQAYTNPVGAPVQTPYTPSPVQTPAQTSSSSTGSSGGGGGAAAFGAAWTASGGRTPQDLANFIKQHPEYGATVGGTKGDKVTIGGRTYDAVLSAGTGGQGASWNDITDGGGSSTPYTQQPGSAQGTSSPLLEQILSRLLSESQQGGASGNSPFNDTIRSTILGRLQKAQKAPTLQDPEIAPQIGAYNSASNRALHQGQEQFAESAYAHGLPTGSQDANLQGSIQNAARDQGNFAASTLGEQLTANRQEITQLLQLGSAVLTSDEQIGLKRELSALDAELQRLGLSQGNQQFYDKLGFDVGSQEATLNALLLQLAGGGA